MLTEEQIERYEEDGYLLLPRYLSHAELDVLRGELPVVFGEESPRRVLEEGSGAVRGVHGVHETSSVFRTLVRLPRLVGPARQLLGSDVHVFQFKINAKLALVGEVWEWHQDYRFWRDEDGMETDRALSVAVLMDDVDEFNGPLMFVPGSHRDGLCAVDTHDADWTRTLTSKLKHSLRVEALAAAAKQRGIVAPKAPAGSVLLFHSNILHGSGPNMSPDNRTMVLISYNSVENPLRDVPDPRPEFLASRTPDPVVTVGDDALAAGFPHGGRGRRHGCGQP
ncbi:phytanoyl-CoA dioxygenase family protein [Streptomyces sp. NPDC059096]|uniref:phytanoyl-CoA dioxygenase family protein n=1 Tax=unclassified Streptomyces TaxID=2593676 RepID=UPI0036951994